MAKKSKGTGKSAPVLTQLLAGKTVYIAGELASWKGVDELTYLTELRGGKIVSDVSNDLSYLVLGTAKFASKKTDAERRNAKGLAQIDILDDRAFRELLRPTPTEFVELLTAGSEGVTQCAEYLKQLPVGVDLKYVDLRKMGVASNHPESDLQHLLMDGVDLRGAQLYNVSLGGLVGAQCDGATFIRCRVEGSRDVSGASFKKIDAFGAKFRGCLLTGADFSDSKLEYGEFRACRGERVDFSNAHLKKCDMTEMNLKNSCFSNANLDGARLTSAVVLDSNFAYASFREGYLSECNLSKCDLTGADLCNADLSGANLRGAKLDGARLQGARLFQTQFDQGALRQLGVSEDAITSIGPKLSELSDIAAKASSISAKVRIGKISTSKVLSLNISSAGTRFEWDRNRAENNPPQWTSYWTKSVPVLFQSFAHRYREETLDLESLQCESSGSPVSGRALRRLLIGVLNEVFCIPPLDEKMLAARKVSQATEVSDLLERVIPMLKDPRNRQEGLRQLDQFDRKSLMHLKGADLSRVILPAIDLGGLDLTKCVLDDADLTNARLNHSKLCQASLKNATLTSALMWSADLRDADLSGADLSQADLDYVTWSGAILKKTNLTGATLRNGQFKGADFSHANLTDTILWGGIFDETTKWPKGFSQWMGMKWHGSGPNPRLQQAKDRRAADGPIDMTTFIKRLESEVEPSRLSRALAMLKADRFRFFSEVTGESVTGVIKSQNDPDLIYACRLDADGAHSCCTKDLHACGGFRGSLCKHLLALIVGLTKAGELDPSLVDQWIAASRLQKPLLDKDKMGEILLKYNEAEAGDIDWRPTETIPEDYYAL